MEQKIWVFTCVFHPDMTGIGENAPSGPAASTCLPVALIWHGHAPVVMQSPAHALYHGSMRGGCLTAGAKSPAVF